MSKIIRFLVFGFLAVGTAVANDSLPNRFNTKFARKILGILHVSENNTDLRRIESEILQSLQHETCADGLIDLLARSLSEGIDADGDVTATGFTLSWQGLSEANDRGLLFVLLVECNADGYPMAARIAIKPRVLLRQPFRGQVQTPRHFQGKG